MNQALLIDGEIEQECAVVANAPIIEVGQVGNGLHLRVLALVVEPPGPYARITL